MLLYPFLHRVGAQAIFATLTVARLAAHKMPNKSTVRGQVAAEVRAEMGRNKITVNRLVRV